MAEDDAIQSFLVTWEQSESAAGSIPHAPVQCCCGNDACAYLKHSQRALEGLEREVRTAAKLGQALLLRHETYIQDSERERKAMTAHIEMLEVEKHQLEKKNASVIEENRELLDQLESVNNAVADSDAQVTNLQATLLSTQQELHKLSSLAARAERLEQQLAYFEREQVLCQKSLSDKEQSEKDALRRWREAERKLADLQEQLERIESEANAERERHVEVLGRMERRHVVEKELGSAAGRLKGAAAAKTTREAGGTNVVSHFVKDILQDNANLQMGIVELREMLQNSNDEVENLRKQMLEHQVADGDGDDATELRRPSARSDLRQEMQRANSQELHVHHHYHAPAPASKASAIRRPKKKRPDIDSNAPNSDLTSPLSNDLLEPVHSQPYYQTSPRRAASHESLLSVHGMDIHTIKPRPSQLLARSATRSFTSQAVVSDAFAQAGSAAMSRPSDSGIKMGGWLVGRWGATPTKSDDGKSTTSSTETSSIKSAGKSWKSSASTLDPEATPKKPVVKLRSPGINQTGPIFGLGPEIRVQHEPIVKKFDEEAMRKALESRSG
ncbi:hypothetical protein EJ03DRAFT_310939 [Teratosphaeria nubilosa]|uniref:Uncharacterized protein n=1 Tax=Teratosphaeria nubilosa TaxID=161662 RepID=A0A6G1LCA7_9PEZI|nr:hypothetical protein EJ03DRAFT_310939 [Teratosphaeria nubilosa]